MHLTRLCAYSTSENPLKFWLFSTFHLDGSWHGLGVYVSAHGQALPDSEACIGHCRCTLASAAFV